MMCFTPHAVIPEFRASEISGTQGVQSVSLLMAPGSRLSALARSGRDDKTRNWSHG